MLCKCYLKGIAFVFGLSQYCLFKGSSDRLCVCVLQDPASYRDLRLPMGAINPARLAEFKKRYADMPQEEGFPPPFLYGTHYSCPG